ncbi:MAG: hypothetical protein NZ889_00265 [Candidatus Pacearchaeota archaeon]|nr:hypothetical protein [Candidatus Pacearchaeota archaeon]
MNKRATETLLYHSIFSIIILTFLLSVVIYFISTKTAEGTVPKIISKELCLVSMAKKNTTIIIDTKFIIEKYENGFLVKKNKFDPGFFYPCHSKFEFEKKDNKTIIFIE